MVVILGRVAHGVYVRVNEYAGRLQKRRHERWIRRETNRSLLSPFSAKRRSLASTRQASCQGQAKC